MSKSLKYFLFLFWLGGALICAMLLFTRGFFLVKKSLDFQSSYKSQSKMEFCDGILNSSSLNEIKGEIVLHCTEEWKHILSNQLDVKIDNSQYSFKNKVKVILIVVDALRFDFAEFDANLNLSETLYFKNKLTVIRDVLKKAPERGKLFKFIADPPTFTIQRLNALTTGSIPTFKDINSNMGTYIINEDNIIDQLYKAKKNITFIGDSTLTDMFPGRFKRQYAYPTFALWDLDSVDTKVKEETLFEMEKNDWDLIIAYFSGLDHCGHYYGPNHREMGRKLQELNTFIENITKKMGDDTMLLVIGDHGMTETGNHGGGSKLEVTSALFAYSLWPFISNFEPKESVYQVDLVPTLASIMGVPIPFSNVGSVIVNILPSYGLKPDICHNWIFVLTSLWTNIKQITLYIQEYENAKALFPPEELDDIKNSFQQLGEDIKLIVSEKEILKFISDYYSFIRRVEKMCEKAWVQINIYAMFGGLFSYFVLLTLLFLLIECLPAQYLEKVVESMFIYFVPIYGTMVLSAIILFTLKYLRYFVDIEQYFCICVCIISITFVVIMGVTRLRNVLNKLNVVSERFTTVFVLTRLTILISVVGYFGSSYIVNEAFSSSFLTIALISTCVAEVKGITKPDTETEEFNFIFVLKTFLNSARGKAMTLSLTLFAVMRFSLYLNHVCRPGQLCTEETPLITDLFRCILSIVLITFFTSCTVVRLQRAGSLVGFPPTLLTSCFAPAIIVTLIGTYWLLQIFSSDPQHKIINLEHWQLTLLSRAALCILLISLALFICPLCVSFNIHPNLFFFSKLRGVIFKQISETGVKSYSAIFSLAYNVTFIKISLFLTLLVSLLLGCQQAASAVYLSFSLWLIATVSSLVCHAGGDTTQVPWWSVVAWGLSCQHFFFATGHQATFSSINWNSASLLSSDSAVTSFIVPAILVSGNVFSSHLLHAVLLPLLIAVPCTLNGFTVLTPDSDIVLSELSLFEQDSQINCNMFKLCIQYMFFSGLRVLVCLLFVFFQPYHYGVRDIFAPKIVFECVAFMITLPAMMIGFFLLQQVNRKLILCYKNPDRIC